MSISAPRVIAGLLAGVALATLAVPGVQAQETPRWSLGLDVGAAVPHDRLASMLTVSGSMGFDLSYRLGDRLSLLADARLQEYGSELLVTTGQPAPEMDVWQYQVGLGVRLADLASGSIPITLETGLGAGRYESNVVDPDTGEATRFDELYPTLFTGLRGDLPLGRHFALFARGRFYFGFSDESETVLFEEVSRAGVDRFSTVMLSHFGGGVRVRF